MTVPEGMIVVRRIRVLDGKPSVVPPKEQAWLLHGDCLYDLDSGDWDAHHPNQLSAQFSAMPPWKGGEHVRVFCFPLVGNTVRATNQDPSSPDQGKTFHVSSSIGSGLTEDVWFERGVGIVKESDVHAGTTGLNQPGVADSVTLLRAGAESAAREAPDARGRDRPQLRLQFTLDFHIRRVQPKRRFCLWRIFLQADRGGMASAKHVRDRRGLQRIRQRQRQPLYISCRPPAQYAVFAGAYLLPSSPTSEPPMFG